MIRQGTGDCAGLAFFILLMPGPAVRLEAATQGIPLDPKKAITQYVHAVWQREQGLPQNSVQAIVQTRDGYLWLGTQEGLVRFDGVRFTSRRSQTTLLKSRIASLQAFWVLKPVVPSGDWIKYLPPGLRKK